MTADENPIASGATMALPVEAIGQRRIALRTKGQVHGPIRRLVSPGDTGEAIKPFVFLDLFSLDASTPARFGMHPHSGIATLTVLVSGEMQFQDRHGNPSSLAAGGIEWMMAGGGVWHGSALTSPASVRGFQLWVALPPTLECAEPQELFLKADEVPTVGPARVLLGEYGGATSKVRVPSSMTYLHVVLGPDETWTYTPPNGHDIAWLAVDSGELHASAPISANELAVFEDGADTITIVTRGPSSFVLGSAAKHPYPLVTGYYSVHTNPAALAAGEAQIVALERDLRRQGRIG